MVVAVFLVVSSGSRHRFSEIHTHTHTHTHTRTLCQKIEQQKNEAVLDCTTTHAVPQNTKVRIVKKLT